MKRAFAFLFVLAVAAAGFAGGIWYTHRQPDPTKPEHKLLYWEDPMHPAYKSDKPGIAPDCGMELVPVYSDTKPAGSTLPSSTLDVGPDKQQLIGVTFATAELSSSSESIHAVGKVAIDETRITRVHPKIDGWISQVNVDFLGQVVKQGDALLTIYSPEMVATEQEFLLALRARDQMKNSASRDAAENSEAMVNASRHRLERWEMSAAQIEDLERTRTPVKSVTLYSPAAGYVMARNAFPSQKVAPETELYALADLSHVWILADVFETDFAKLQLGQSAWVSPSSAGGRGFAARVDFIQPQADPTTRTIKVRLDASNPDRSLKPDLFVNIEFRMGGASRVTVPSDAVVNTGTRQTVFVDQGNGRLERRDVEMGDRIGDRTQILRGLKPGERVVASGTFLIDSEAQLKNGARQ